MRYVIAILRGEGRHDVMGRSRRVTQMLNYNENRVYTHSTAEMSEIGVDKGQTQNTSQWGWRLYEEMKRWRRVAVVIRRRGGRPLRERLRIAPPVHLPLPAKIPSGRWASAPATPLYFLYGVRVFTYIYNPSARLRVTGVTESTQ